MRVDLLSAETLARSVVHRALDAGVDMAEAYLRAGQGSRITLARGSPPVMAQGVLGGLSLRVWQGDRMGFASTSSLSHDGLLALPDLALTAARCSGPSDRPVLPVPREFPPERSLPEMGVLDRHYGEIPEAEKRALCEKLLTAPAIGPNRTILYQDELVSTAVANSHGYSSSYPSTNFTLCLIQNEAGSLAQATSSRMFAGLDPEGVLSRATENRLEGTGVPPPPGSEVDVVLPPHVGAELVRLLGALLTADSGLRSVPALARKVGEAIGSPLLTLVDDPSLPSGSHTRPIDDEGYPCSQAVLMAEGVLRGFLHSGSTAAATGVEVNGRAYRAAFDRLPRAAPTNLLIQPRAPSHYDLCCQLGRGMEIAGLARRSGIGPSGGDWVLLADGWWIEEGRRAGPLAGVRLACNLFTALRNIDGVAANLEFSPLAGGAGSPSLLIRRMRVLG